ncbi:MAG TPA: putative DNA binding domain-containing protein [Anaerolineaceae bacterium]|mgnify:CR=1 FL=1|nr:putative DNA binding domain-containing protein [Anaerolineaceae bacterium]
MIEEILLERIAAGENERTEFKRDFDSASGVLPSMIAFANGVFEGWIIFGVTDEGTSHYRISQLA